MDYTKELTHISLCSGYGGIDLGLKRAIGDVRTIAYSEIADFACANLVAKMEAEGQPLDAAPIWTNLKTFPWAEFCGRVDILSGGFPCQPFSAAGRRRGDDDPRHLWPHIVTGIRELGRPPIVFFENVEGIISSKLSGDEWSDPAGTPVLLHVLRELERLGYDSTAGVFSASEIGASHQRKRVFILGVRTHLSAEGRSLVSKRLERTERGCMGDTSSGNKEPRGGSRALPAACIDRQADVAAWAGYTWPAGRGASEPHERARDGELAHANDARDAALQYGFDAERSQEGKNRGGHLPLGGAVGRRAFERWSTDAAPAGRGAKQHAWEPPRVTHRVDTGAAPADDAGSQPEMGGGANGIADRLGYAELSSSCDSRQDELMLIGNGVVPATAERAFRVLWGRVAL